VLSPGRILREPLKSLPHAIDIAAHRKTPPPRPSDNAPVRNEPPSRFERRMNRTLSPHLHKAVFKIFPETLLLSHRNSRLQSRRIHEAATRRKAPALGS
jgi:hypothetical protein